MSGANGFGYFCQDKSNPLACERKLLLVILQLQLLSLVIPAKAGQEEQRPWIPAFAGMTIKGKVAFAAPTVRHPGEGRDPGP